MKFRRQFTCGSFFRKLYAYKLLLLRLNRSLLVCLSSHIKYTCGFFWWVFFCWFFVCFGCFVCWWFLWVLCVCGFLPFCGVQTWIEHFRWGPKSGTEALACYSQVCCWLSLLQGCISLQFSFYLLQLCLNT